MSTPVAEIPRQEARNVAVDAYRGFVMVLMMAEILQFAHVARSFPGNPVWQFLGFQQSHVEWAGMSLHDTIQPGFTFLAGVSLPYSLASRRRKSESFRHMLLHVALRSLLLIALGILLRSIAAPMINFTFVDTLTQIGLGYTFAFLIAFLKPRWQWISLAAILFGYWLTWALYPAPGSDFNWAAVGVAPDWHQHLFAGFAAHWNKNSNLGQAFDVWFLNLFPRTAPFTYNAGGYLTLNFIPTLGTLLLGLITGRWYREVAPRIPFRRLLVTGAILCAVVLVLHFAGICPIVKRIWTPSWTLFSGGICMFFLAAFSWVVDVKNQRRLVFPLLVVGMNSIAAYLIADLCGNFVDSKFYSHLGLRIFDIFGTAMEPLVLGSLALFVYWLMLYWMYRKKIFLRI
jgi:heparan-alpha-glucosaminide N-acetyltransferase